MPDEKSIVMDKKTETSAEPDRLLYTQLFVCLFVAAVFFFSWRQGGPLWGELSQFLHEILEEGISFSGQQELTRLTDEVRDFLGRIVEAWGPLSQ